MQKQTKPPKRTPRRAGAPTGPRKAGLKRAALLEAAGRLFEEKGYEATTMDEIAAAAGYAKGTLYHYFANKAALLNALRSNFDREIVSRIRAHVDACPADDWRGRLRAWIESAIETYFQMSEMHDVVIYGSGMPFRNAMADSEITTSLAALIADGRQAGAWDVDDVQWTAVIMFYSYRGGCDEAMLGAQDRDEIPHKLNDLFLRMLGVQD